MGSGEMIEGRIRGTDLWVGIVSPMRACLGRLTGIRVESRIGTGNGEPFDGRPAARTVSLFPGRDPAVSLIGTCHLRREFVDGIWGKIHVQVMYDTLPGLFFIGRRGKRENGAGVPAMYTGHLGDG